MSIGLLISVALISASAAILGVWYSKARARILPEVSEEDFLGFFGPDQLERRKESVLLERARVADVLGIPVDKLAAQLSYQELHASFDFLGQLSVAWSDLEYDLKEECLSSKIDFDQEMMTTVGSYVSAIVEARESVAK
jgi:hypothetical protein